MVIQLPTVDKMIEEPGGQTLAYFQVLQAVQHSADLRTALLEYAHLRHSDSRISELYRTAGYSPGRQTFEHTPQRDSAMRLLMEKDEDWSGEEPWDVHRGLREEMNRTCVEAGLFELENVSSEFMDYTEDVQAVPMAPFWRDDQFTSPQMYRPRSENATPRSSRGLKRLSRRVKEVVQERATSTYKDVADDLIRELDHMEIANKEKEAKNIHRRVYDALNVLIAAGVMGKRGKHVIWRGAELCYQPPTESQEMIQHSVHEKRRQLQELVEQYSSLKALIFRNEQKSGKDRIHLPALLVTTRGKAYASLSFASQKTQLCISAPGPISQHDLLACLPHLRLSKSDWTPDEDLKRALAGPR